MDHLDLSQVITQEFLDTLFPTSISDEFFEALYGDASEGAYDIRLEYISSNKERLVLAFNLTKRADKCLVCSLTYGLPNVFSRHPKINIKGIVEKIKEKGVNVKEWRLGQTEENSASLHVIPFFLELNPE